MHDVCRSELWVQGKLVVQWGSRRGFNSQVGQRMRGDKGLWIRKIKEKTKLRKLLQTLEVSYSKVNVALSKYIYTKVSHEESRHSLKGLVHMS
jgi:hypothetical protein